MSLGSVIVNIETQASKLEDLIKELECWLVFKGFNKEGKPIIVYEDGKVYLQWYEYTISLEYAKEAMEEKGYISKLDFNQWYSL
jgi:hypothetical protein|nr:MAG TPA: hypothetical protein [Caudoviricetes sp.]